MGRLIDADKLMEDVRKNSESYFADDFAKQWVDRQQTTDAISLDWIRAYIDHLKAMGVQLSLRDAQAVSVMVDKYMMEQNATCGPDYCEIGGTHND